LDAGDHATRVLELPGADFAHYRWGATLDPIVTGLSDRAHLVRELIPYGEAGTVDLLRAIDRRMQEGVLEPKPLPDLARLLGAGEILLRNNIQYVRFRSPRPRGHLGPVHRRARGGPVRATPFGPPVREDEPAIPFTDENHPRHRPRRRAPTRTRNLRCLHPVPVVRAAATAAPLLIDGSGEALVDAAAAGLLGGVVDASRAVLYTARPPTTRARSKRPSPTAPPCSSPTPTGAGRSGGPAVRENFGLHRTGRRRPPRTRPNDNRLPLFPAADASHQTVAYAAPRLRPRMCGLGTRDELRQQLRLQSRRPPVRAIDGDATTAWRVGAFTDPVGEGWQVNLAEPTTTGRVRLIQPITGPRTAGSHEPPCASTAASPVTVNLDDSSRTPTGQVVHFPRRTFSDSTSASTRRTRASARATTCESAVGFAEVEIPARNRLPILARRDPPAATALLGPAGSRSLEHPLVLQIARDRANPAEPFKLDTESVMAGPSPSRPPARSTWREPRGCPPTPPTTNSTRSSAGRPPQP
jgi:hypothetical protein